MKSLRKTVIDSRNDYDKGTHYIYFNCRGVSNVSATNKKCVSNVAATNKKTLYLTYAGILKILFGSRSGNANKFVNWATKTLFTAQMGTPAERKKLAANIITPANIKSFFSKTGQSLPVIYLFTLGIVKDLRKTFAIDEKHNDNDIVAKLGTSNDFGRRTGEHQSQFGKLKNVKLELTHYNYIDESYMFAAEADLKGTFGMMNLFLEHEKYKELMIFDKKIIQKIKDQYESVSKSYVGNLAGVIAKMKDLETKHENDMLKKDLEIANEKHLKELVIEKYSKELMVEKHSRELMNEKHQREILKKDLEMMKKDMEVMKLSKQK